MKLEIKSETGKAVDTKVYFDGIEQKGICRLHLNIDPNRRERLPTVTLDILVEEIDVSINNFNREYRTYETDKG